MNKKIIQPVIAFFTAAICAAVIFAICGIYPGSERTLLIFDMQEQFASFYSSLKSVFNGTAGFGYTFKGSLGSPYIGMFAYYLASPVTLITLFFDTRHIPDAIWLMDIIKCGLIAASFSVFISFRGVKNTVHNLVLSLCWALSASSVTFFILPMYLDTLFWLPVICIFLEKLFKSSNKSVKKEGLLYALFLALCMITHYYSAYMVCIFLCFYAAMLIAEIKPENAGMRCLDFIIYSVLGAVFASPLLIPVCRELFPGKAFDSGVYSDGSIIVTAPFDLIKQFICGHFGYLYSEGAPAIYFTIIILILALFGIFKNRKDKAVTAVCVVTIIFFIASFIFRPFYRIWHMFRDPVAYPHRFAFLFVFFMLVMAAKGLSEIEKAVDSRKKLLPVVYALSVLVPFLLLADGVMITGAEYDTLSNASRSDYCIFIDTTDDLISEAKADSILNYGDKGLSLCRINKDYEFTSNDPMLLGFNGMDYFSSSYDPYALKLFKNLGILQYHYKVCDEGTTIVTDMLLGIDYSILKDHPEYGYELISSNGFSTLFKNPYSLGLGYLAGDDCTEFGTDPFENQNIMVSSIVGEEIPLFESLDYEISSKTAIVYTFIAPSGKSIYMNFELLNESDLDYEDKSNPNLITVNLDDVMLTYFTGYQRASNIYIGRFDEDTEVKVTVEGTLEQRNAFIYALDNEKLDEVYNKIAENRFIPDYIGTGEIRGKITVSDDKINDLVMTIPYSSGLRVYVDGKRTGAERYAGCLLTVKDLEAGEHEIILKF